MPCIVAAACSKNVMAGTAAVQKVDSLKLYLGCAATGEDQTSIVAISQYCCSAWVTSVLES
jgi:hypothetical protein